jgi:rod shape-determining protein MreC
MEGKAGVFARHRKTGVFFLLIAVGFVMLLLSTRSLAGFPERIGLSIASVFQRVFDAVSSFASQSVNSMAELRRLKKNYDEAIDKLEQYQNIERGLAETREENKRLREQLGFASDPSLQKMAARIIAKDPENIRTTLVIDKGIKQGIRKNFPVIAFQDGIQGLVGRVTEVGQTTSIVLPLYDPTSNVGARLERGRYEGLATGTGDESDGILLRYVKKLAKDDIQFGDLVVTSGMWRTYPEGIAIGRIGKIIEADYKTSIEYRVEPVIDFSRLEYVFVVFPQAEEIP